MPRPTDQLDLTTDDASAVVDAMGRLAAAGKGWINIAPLVIGDDGYDVAPGGPEVMATWEAPHPRRRGPATRVEIGIQHRSVGRAAPRLLAAGQERAPGWRVLQDHSRRGLVVAAPVDAEHATVLAWLLRTAGHLAAEGVSGRWRAWIYPG